MGLERGWRERDVAEGGRVAGLRTFALAGLLGGVLALGGPVLLAAGAVGVALYGAVSYREAVRSTGNLSVTSTLALLLTFGLGALAVGGQAVLALGAAVVVAVLLDLRPALHRWLQLMEHRELRAALQMGVLSVVVLPLLPDADYGPYGALNPYRLWWAVVLIAGLSLTGYVAIRLAGSQRGLLWTGLLGGLASSTATTLALARQLAQQPALLHPALAGALSACAVMFLRMLVVLLSLAPPVGRTLLLPMLASAATLIIVALVQWRRRPPDQRTANLADMRPFDLGTALGFGAFLGTMSMLTEAGKVWIGDSGLYALALISGVADVDAITLSLARMQVAGSVPGTVAAWAIALAALSNLCAKAVIGWRAGNAALGRGLAVGYALSALAGALALAASITSQ